MIEFKALIDDEWKIVLVSELEGYAIFDKIDKYYVFVKENGVEKRFEIDKEQAKQIVEIDRLNTIWNNEEKWIPENKGKQKIFRAFKELE